jgi:cell division protease FtsH
MVTDYGMSSSIGSVKLSSGSGDMFLGRDMGHSRDYSERLSEQVDVEVRELIEAAHDEAWQVLTENRDILDRLASELLEKETLDHTQIAEIFNGVKKLPPRPQWLSSPERPVSERPPVSLPAKAPIDSGSVDGGVDSDPKPKPKRAPRKAPGIATA